jgi:hypothetical protein
MVRIGRSHLYASNYTKIIGRKYIDDDLLHGPGWVLWTTDNWINKCIRTMVP